MDSDCSIVGAAVRNPHLAFVFQGGGLLEVNVSILDSTRLYRWGKYLSS